MNVQRKPAMILLLVTIFAVSINLRPAITSIGPMFRDNSRTITINKC